VVILNGLFDFPKEGKLTEKNTENKGENIFSIFLGPPTKIAKDV